MSEPINFDALLERADLAHFEGDEAAELSDEELELVAAELEKPDTPADKFTLIRILGVSYATKYRSLLERFLVSEGDAMLAYAALGMLCDYWGLTEEYQREILQFIKGVSWDENEELRSQAISVAGEYLREEENKEFLQMILEIFEDESQDQYLREAAYSSLARAVGRNYTEIPPASRSFDLVKDIDPAVIQEVKQRLDAFRLG
jgi:hypothetical protein